MKRSILALILIFAVILCTLTSCGTGNKNVENESSTPTKNPSPSEPESTSHTGLEFELNEDGASYSVVSLGNCTDNNIVIPSTYNGLPITKIGEHAFSNHALLSSITIPDSIKSIGFGAFSACTALKSLTLPEGLEVIEPHAFSYCLNLKQINIPNSVKSIDHSVFYSSDNINYNTYDNALYIGSEENPYIALVKAKNSSITSCEINSQTKFILSDAFSNCQQLASIDIPESVLSIGYSCFEYCSSLQSISLPESLTSIGSHAFSNCSSLKNISIPQSIESIGYSPFSYCDSLAYSEYDNAMYLGNENNPYLILSKAKSTSINSCTIHKDTKFIENYAFSYCSNLGSLTIPNGVVSIGQGAFSSCFDSYKNSTLHISASVSLIGEEAFRYCNVIAISVDENNKTFKSVDGNLYSKDGTVLINYARNKKDSSFTVPSGVTTIGKNAFQSNSKITTVNLPNSITTIEDYAFAWCSNLKNINIPDNVSTIGFGSFQNTAIVEIILPEGLRVIDYAAFSDCQNLTSINLPESLIELESSVFKNCSSLVVIENGVHYVNNWVVGSEKDLINVSIRQGTVGICNAAFYNREDLAEIVIPDSVEIIGKETFADCSALQEITMLGVTYIGKSAFKYCDSLSSITVSNKLTRIFNDAFYGCNEFSLNFAGAENEWLNVKVHSGNIRIPYAKKNFNFVP